ncbi:MAG: imidazole glycerol phosphate synthase subunit HisH [Burkholderiales bacterium]|nr:imidazole glycerol phosphate synthase subunit HisH [Burkholderiales bacterium]
MINVIDHGTGNIASINNCLEKVDAQYRLASEPNRLEEASHIIIPGVGHFESAILNLKKRALDQAIINASNRGVPILGICLGMQILYEFSEEGNSDGLGLMSGRVVKKTPSNADNFKVPNVGWLSVECKKESRLFQDINNEDTVFYFANSYAVKSHDQSYATSSYSFDDDYVASLEKGNIYGTQFHPEKSGDVGHKLMQNFLNIGQQT